MHENNIVHCDIKPSNIIINNNHLKLIDFGSCCILENNKSYDNSEYETFLGTEGYMAPEQYHYKIYYSTDIYSLCVCITEILVGKLWYEEDNYFYSRQELLNSINNLTKYRSILFKGVSENHLLRPSLDNIQKIFL